MKAKKLELRNFRNYSAEQIEFCDSINIICGDNGMGKTNIAEAVYYFSHGRSFRSSGREIIKDGEDKAKIRLCFESGERKFDGEIRFFGGKKKEIMLNEIELKKTSQLLGNFICVLFTPDELNIVKGMPEMRRKFCDSAIMPLRPNYIRELIRYRTVVSQKTALLKAGKYETLSVWNEKMVESGLKIINMRRSYIDKINLKAREMQKDISAGREILDIKYSPSVKDEESFRKKLELSSVKEKENRMCLCGPHRDDISFEINGKAAKSYASQGQIRTAVLCLKSAQMEIIKEVTGKYPVLLLDDILSELDKKRRDYLISEIIGKQVIITCTDIDFESAGANIIKIKDGKAVR